MEKDKRYQRLYPAGSFLPWGCGDAGEGAAAICNFMAEYGYQLSQDGPFGTLSYWAWGN